MVKITRSEVIKGSIQKSPGVVRETRETQTERKARGAANVPIMTKVHNTPLVVFA